MKIKNPISKLTLIFIYLALIIIWHWLVKLYGMTLTNYGPLTWDVFGYYVYLPAIFDFHDLHHMQHFQDLVRQNPDTASIYFAGYQLGDGNFVMKYSSGNTILYSPFYFAGKLYAKLYGYPQDGLSQPYQISMIFCGFFYCFMGLFILRKVLINFFSDRVTAFTLITVALATNYVEYSTYTSLLTHNTLFFINSCILLITINSYKNFTYKNAILLGLLLGIAPLIRPTEIVTSFIPLLYGIQNYKTLLYKLNKLRVHYKKVAITIILMSMVGSIQLIYWKTVTGHFLFYSYPGQYLELTSPHIYNCMFSTTNGWLVYTPIMFFALIGIYFCYRQIKYLFWAMLVYVLLHMYFTFSWQIWWYGSSFGQRAMIQSYPMFSIALGCLVTTLFRKNYKIIISVLALSFFIWLNIFQTYQAHEGIINISQMTDKYYIKVFGKAHITNKEYQFLDNVEELDSSQIQSSKSLYRTALSSIDSSFITSNPDSSKKQERCLLFKSSKKNVPVKSDLTTLNILPGNWIIVSFDAFVKNKIYNRDQMSFIQDELYNKWGIIKEKSMKIPDKIGNDLPDNFDAYGHAGVWDRVTFDFMIPKTSRGVDSLIISLHNPDGQNVYLNNIQIDCIKTK